jgi:predicted ATPase
MEPMLTHLSIKNFKAWADTGPIRLAPLTVLFGTNSSGKSSLGHLLLALKQTVLSTDRKRALHLGDANSLIDLGTFADCLHGHDLALPLSFSLRWRVQGGITVRDALARSKQFSGNEIELSARLVANATQQPETEQFRYRVLSEATKVLEVTHTRKSGGGELASEPLRLVHATGRKWPAEPPEKFYRFTDRTLLRYQNADFLADFALLTERVFSQFFYLGPLRKHPERVYQWSGDTPADVGMQGESAIAALLAATQEGRQLNRGHRQRKQRFDAFIAGWLKELGVIADFSVKPVAKGRKEYEVLLRTAETAPEVKLTDVGFGVSQVLPALVQAFYAPANSVVWMEQPEIHLHPRVQSSLADAFMCAVQAWEGGTPRGTQLIIESHSEHFLSRLQRRVAEGTISKDDVAIYFVRRDEESAHLEALRLTDDGDIENWPEDFFGDEMADVAARMKAAQERRRQSVQGSPGAA